MEKSLRVLIISAAFGNGHIRAAEAVIDAIKKKRPDAEIFHIDFGSLVNPTFNTALKSTYINLIKYIPKIWGLFYYVTSSIPPDSAFQRFLNKMGRSKLIEQINVLQPDLIICAYPTVAGVLGQLKLEQALDIPLATVVTDYAVHSQWINSGVDLYIVGCDIVAKGFVARGLDAKNIKVTGIPVKPEFERDLDRQKIAAEMGLATDRPTILIMGGAYGVLREVKEICRWIADSTVPAQLIVVCGKDKKLYDSLADITEGTRNPIRRFGFVDNVEQLMTVADVMVTKAGGLTVSEGLTKRLPMVIFNPIPGQEEQNAKFLDQVGAGRVANSLSELKNVLQNLITRPEEIEKMRRAASNAIPGLAAERAVEYMLQLLQTNEKK